MSENFEKDTPSSVVVNAASAGIARRKLIRAGLAAAPVMLALKSQSALAGGSGQHLNCSVWASLSAAKGCTKSHAPAPKSTCNGYDKWKDVSTTSFTKCGAKFNYDSNSADNVPFDGYEFRDTYDRRTTYHNLKMVCGGVDSKGRTFSGVTGDKQLLAKHCAAMILNCSVGNSPLTESQVKSIWSSCKDGGTWTLPSGGTWTRTQCNDYFNYICLGIEPSGWQLDCRA
jgi:hypothetical protein